MGGHPTRHAFIPATQSQTNSPRRAGALAGESLPWWSPGAAGGRGLASDRCSRSRRNLHPLACRRSLSGAAPDELISVIVTLKDQENLAWVQSLDQARPGRRLSSGRCKAGRRLPKRQYGPCWRAAPYQAQIQDVRYFWIHQRPGPEGQATGASGRWPSGRMWRTSSPEEIYSLVACIGNGRRRLGQPGKNWRPPAVGIGLPRARGWSSPALDTGVDYTHPELSCPVAGRQQQLV